MYWVERNDTIYFSKLDGTGRTVFLRIADSHFDGMVIDVRRDRSVVTLISTLQCCLSHLSLYSSLYTDLMTINELFFFYF